MKFHFPPAPIRLRKNRFNPHRYWIILLSCTVLFLTAELVYFSWYFLHTTKTLDAPVLPKIETNATKIRAMERKLQHVEDAIQQRTGQTIQPQLSPDQAR